MSERPWIDVLESSGAHRVELRPGLTRVGGPDADCPMGGWTSGELHLWDEPPRLIHTGAGPRPEVNGTAVEETELAPGDRIAWSGAQLVFHSASEAGGTPSPSAPEQAPRTPEVLPSTPDVLEEIPLETAPTGAVAAVPIDPDDPRSRLFAKLWAGVIAEQGLGHKGETKRWQDATLRGEFDADAAARDLLRRETPSPDDPRVVARADRLMRDLLMAPVTQGVRGASRRARNAAQSGTAFILAQFLGILVYTAVILVVMLLVRVKWEYSFDGLFDSFLGRG